VEEMLLYTAELKRPRQEPLASKRVGVGVYWGGSGTCQGLGLGHLLPCAPLVQQRFPADASCRRMPYKWWLVKV